jgi:hypothetical protein
MVQLDRSEVRATLLDILLKFKIHFSIKFFQNGVPPGWRRRISRRVICYSMVVRDRRRSSAEGHFRDMWLQHIAHQNEAPPAEFYCSLEECVPKRVALAVLGFLQRREFSGEQTI